VIDPRQPPPRVLALVDGLSFDELQRRTGFVLQPPA
jgi:hypothetical protein